ncbi:MAG: amidohydrolase [Planctomycetaceae bacterium]|nr:amidohydrolase [Planctomycetaceae bacterium]
MKSRTLVGHLRTPRRAAGNLVFPLFWGILAGTAIAGKPQLAESVAKRADTCWDAAQQIWRWAEAGYQEHQSSALLAQMLEEAGFRVERGVADMPTAFVATFGQGAPVIGILAEFDSLPGLSQQAVPQQAPVEAGGNGHGCGHHLFGVASASAAIALAERIKAGELPGTIRCYGCPAEEGGSGKVYLVRAGRFDDCDVVLHWHPGDTNAAGDSTCLARVAAKFRFHGKSAHAGSAPEQGRSALDAVELTNFAAQLLREHTPDFTRIHHVITAGGGAPNVVPDFAEVFYYVRHPKADVVQQLYERLLKCAEAGALGTETRLEVDYLGGQWEILPNNTLSQMALKNLRDLNDLQFTPAETEFALRIQNTLDHPKPLDSAQVVVDRSGNTGKGSTDVGDVSWVVPTTGFSTVCWAPGTPGHSWQATAAGGTTIGRKGMLLAAKVLAATAWDLAHDPAAIAAARQEFKQRKGSVEYKPLLTPGQKPPLDYRKSPVAG